MQIRKNKQTILLQKILAFSLAEALLTMAILGVVGALTVPSLKNYSDERIYVSSLKKAYNTIQTATSQLEAKYGNTELWDWDGDQEIIRGWYKNIMNGMPVEDYTIHHFGTGQAWSYVHNGGVWFKSPDGMHWYLSWWNGDGDNVMHHIMYVDTNGSKKPNKVAVDVHAFSIEDEGVFPLGANMYYGNNWWACTNYAIRKGEMPWLKDPSITSCGAGIIIKEK